MLVLVLIACHQADTDAAPSNTITWDADQALSTDLVVAADETLVIQPGVTVTAAAGVGIVVDGALIAEGTADAPILFTGDAAAPWRGITFELDAVNATFEGVGEYASGSIVDQAIVEHATRGMDVAGSSPYLHAVTFRDNELPGSVETVGGSGLLIRDGSTSRIRDCVFDGNIANVFGFGGALYVDHSDPIVQDGVFTDNWSAYGGAIATDVMASPIVGGRFEGNDTQSEGGAISLVSTVSALIGNTVTGNHSATDGAGIHVCVDCNPHAAPFLMDNVVTGNTSDNADPDDGAAGVGAAFLGAFVDNDVHDNFRSDGIPADFSWFNLLSEAWPAWIADPSIDGNWWGTTDLSAIDATIYDGHDHDGVGMVAVEPIRTGPASGKTPRVVLSTRRMRYEDAGDDIPVFLTIYNPGPARTATLTITQAGSPFSGELDYAGATRAGDSWTLEMPENSVWFAAIDETTYDGTPGKDVTWEAELSDGDGLIGIPAVARYLTGPAE
jgi:hypothetical protein